EIYFFSAPSASLRLILGVFAEVVERLLGNRFQGIENAYAFGRYGFKDRFVPLAKLLDHLFSRRDIGEVALVQLKRIRNSREIVPLLLQIFFEVVDALFIGFHALHL